MGKISRKPFRGVLQIIRFNRHFYILALSGIVLFGVGFFFLPEPFAQISVLAAGGIFIPVFLSLAASFYVYDCSPLYSLDWGLPVPDTETVRLLNIHAGFDETSALLQKKYPRAQLEVWDFYDPLKHTEVSIKRARKVFPPYPGTVPVNSAQLPAVARKADFIFLVLAAHEIRDSGERSAFFARLAEILADNGKIILVEHLRDLPNFLVYSLGFFHFFSKKHWQKALSPSGLHPERETKMTPFISIFVLAKNGTAA